MSHEQPSGGVTGDAEIGVAGETQAPGIPLSEAVRVWTKIGLLSFGGPAGQIALMHRILVDEKKWISDSRFMHALNFCMILPGPEAQQLATYIGWLFHRVRGGLIAGTLFILPGFFVILGLSYLYVNAGGLLIVQGLFLGLKAAVIAIVLHAVIRMGRRSLKQPLLVGLAAFAFVGMFFLGLPFPLIIAIAATIGYLNARRTSPAVDSMAHFVPSTGTGDASTRPSDKLAKATARQALTATGGLGILWLAPVALLLFVLGPGHVFSSISLFFSKMAVVTFGGAYAVLAYVAQEAVQAYHWLTPSEMIDGLAMAETTPGPLIMVVQFVGFMAAYRNPGSLPPGTAGLLGSVLTTWVTFVPCFLWIFLGAPYLEKLRKNKSLSSAFSGVTAAVVGVIANLAAWFAIHSLFADVTVTSIAGLSTELPVLSSFRLSSGLITLIAMVLIFRLRASVVVTLAITGLLGMTMFLL